MLHVVTSCYTISMINCYNMNIWLSVIGLLWLVRLTVIRSVSIISIFEISIWESQIRTNWLWMFFWHDVGFQCARVSAQKNTMKFRKSTVWLGDPHGQLRGVGLGRRVLCNGADRGHLFWINPWKTSSMLQSMDMRRKRPGQGARQSRPRIQLFASGSSPLYEMGPSRWYALCHVGATCVCCGQHLRSIPVVPLYLMTLSGRKRKQLESILFPLSQLWSW